MRKNAISRSRNGCAVCKSKRIKCDEARPSCSRCERLGIACPGYPQPLKWTEASVASPSERQRPQGHARRPRQRSTAMMVGDAVPIFSPPNAESALDLDSLSPSQRNAFDHGSPSDLYQMDLFSQVAGGMMDSDTSIMGELTCDALDHQSFLFPMPANQEPSECAASPVAAVELGNSAELWLDALLPKEDKIVTDAATDAVQPRYHDHDDLLHRRQPTTIAGHLPDRSSILVEYYFKDVCGMMSCYDSRMNPYRTTISNVWTRSPSLYYVIQSMAAACLSEVSPDFAATGNQLRDQASASLVTEINSSAASGEAISTSTLLAVVMLGFSLCWHDAGQVGHQQFDLLARTILSSESHQPGEQIALFADTQRKLFFYNSFVYWRMLLSFVTDRHLPTPAFPALHPQPPAQPTQAFSSSPSSTTQPTQAVATHASTRLPHPQTGIGIQVLDVLAQVGTLVRRERHRIRSRRHASRADILASQAAYRSAEDLHAQLQAIDLPGEASVMDSGDETTPIDHLLKVAEAYRCAGLLQLYRNFPDLICAKQTVNDGYATENDARLHTPAETIHSNADMPPPEPSASDESPDSPVYGTLLTCMALHILDLLRGIPTSSRSRSIQPLLHVIASNELFLARRYELPAPGRLPAVFVVLGIPASPPSLADVLAARRVVLSRLATFETVLAARPIRQMKQLVKDSWAAMDTGRDGEVFWMDVMMDGGCETLMG